MICKYVIALIWLQFHYEVLDLMISKYVETLILSIIQGISEFIPVSSSAHLLIMSRLSDFNVSNLQLDISLHLGSLLAIILFFRKELINIINNKNIFLLIILGSIPLVIVGYIFYSTNLIDQFRNLKVVAWTTLIFGILLYFSDKFELKNKISSELNIKSIIIIGLFQILSIIPGVSRSGIVITASRFLKFDRVESSKIAFYLSIPALAGASVLGFKDVIYDQINFDAIFIFSTSASFLFSYFTIKYFLIYVKMFSLSFFVIYRIVLSIILFSIIYL
ncbi:undecaprenyl-diphosphate phosphatase [Candidatus Pelagibacter sp.]|nr:undecaprenyl-diphosphate phosphatase [Candidatus Pelagibacter sp.]